MPDIEKGVESSVKMIKNKRDWKGVEENFSSMYGIRRKLKHGKRVYTAEIKLKNQRIYLGQSQDEVTAAKMYDRIAQELSNLPLNFPDDYPEHVYQPNRGFIEVEVQAALNLIDSKRRKKGPPASQYAGVSWNTEKNRWVATIIILKKIVFIGRFGDEIEAAKAYDAVAKDFSNKQLNFPNDYPDHKFCGKGKIGQAVSSVPYGHKELAIAQELVNNSMANKDEARYDAPFSQGPIPKKIKIGNKSSAPDTENADVDGSLLIGEAPMILNSSEPITTNKRTENRIGAERETDDAQEASFQLQAASESRERKKLPIFSVAV